MYVMTPAMVADKRRTPSTMRREYLMVRASLAAAMSSGLAILCRVELLPAVDDSEAEWGVELLDSSTSLGLAAE